MGPLGLAFLGPLLFSILSMGFDRRDCTGQIGRMRPNKTKIKAGYGKGLRKSMVSYSEKEFKISRNAMMKELGVPALSYQGLENLTGDDCSLSWQPPSRPFCPLSSLLSNIYEESAA